MTDYQKKKLIDLALILVGIVLVGLFLRTQLKDPIVIEVENPEPSTESSYFIGGYTEDNQDPDLPVNMDIKTVEVKMDTAYIDIKIGFDDIPVTLEGDISQLKFEILFDVNKDDDKAGDIIVEHEYKGSGAFNGYAGDLFESRLLRNADEGETILSEVTVEQVDNALMIQVPYSPSLDIHSDTPVRVVFKGEYNQMSYTDIVP
ncbi:hypothetical protein [Fusibacter bizertensis]